jgi:sialate O-acetylesterase
MRALIGSWRKAWGEGDFPFYFVQLSTYSSPMPQRPQGGDSMARLREMQMLALTLGNTGAACAIDIGEAEVHARDKQDVGKRLALVALAKTYGKDVVFSGPVFKSQTIEGNKIRVSFDDVGGGLMLGRKEGIEPVQPEADDKLAWAAIAGADRAWYPADAVIDGATLVFSSEKAANPVAVRYAFARNPAGANLYNKEGLPAFPFRTDNW